MRLISLALLLTLSSPLVASTALAKTATATLRVGATIVPGNSVSAYLQGTEVRTVVRNDEPQAAVHALATPMILSVTFDAEPYFVKLVAWDKSHRFLTINF